MKIIVFLLITTIAQLSAEEPRVLTIYGTVDPRLDVSFMSTYRGTNLGRSECSDMNPSSGRRKVKLAGLSKRVSTTDYNITMPIDYTDANDCGYEFVSIDLIMRRKYDSLYSKHNILARGVRLHDGTSYVSPIYYGKKSGQKSAGPNGKERRAPTSFFTDKRYFCLTKESVFLCKTSFMDYPKDYAEKRESKTGRKLLTDEFHCTLQMQYDDEGGDYHYEDCWKETGNIANLHCNSVTHPNFGMNELKNTTLHINMLVDKNGSIVSRINDRGRLIKKESDVFRELPEPEPTAWEKVKSLF
jgi:hypothetical protein